MALDGARARPHVRISPTLPTRLSIIARRDSDASDASEDTDSASPSDSSPMPRTPPAVPMDLDPAVVRKHSPDDVPSMPSARAPSLATPPPGKPRDHSRRASAFNLLRNIHVPHFHSGASAASAAQQ